MKPFGDLLRQAIEESGKTRAQVAREADISVNMVGKLLSGARKSPGRDIIFKLALTLEKTPGWFFR
jgi:transcriptional regulator with XRE-family HTH domain